MANQYSNSPVTIEERFWAKVDKRLPKDCWPWRGSVDHNGYARIKVGGRNGKNILASRLAWEICNGPIPDGLCVLHHCDNPRCVNAGAHLFLGTPKANAEDRDSKGRLACMKGNCNPRAFKYDRAACTHARANQANE